MSKQDLYFGLSGKEVLAGMIKLYGINFVIESVEEILQEDISKCLNMEIWTEERPGLFYKKLDKDIRDRMPILDDKAV